MFRWSWILLVIFFCAQCFGAEDGGCTQRTVIVTARDSSGKALPYTLQVADLRGKINDKPMRILAATKPTNPSRVALVLDASGSMSAKWQRAVEFAVEIVRESPSSTEFALVIFADNELRTVEFGKTGPEFITEIMSFKNVKPYGRTGLRDAIWKAVSMFEPNQQGDTIVVVSDGEDTQSKVSKRRLREAMWSRGIRVMFAQFVDHVFAREGELLMNDADTTWLSESSGGFLSRIEDPQVLPNVAQEIAFEIENYLAVRVTLPTPLEKQASLHLEAVDPSGRKRKNIELRFPEKLLPCASPASKQ
jgi:Mg-chelatase subunit ChlD